MAEKPQNFWQELKRRKVIRVIIGYAAAAYVLLELTSIIAGPLGLPAWTINFVLVLLSIGFIITIVVSWIYDFTPKGIEKTKPAKVAGEDEQVLKPGKRKLKVSDIIITVLLVAVIILLYPRVFEQDRIKQLRSADEIIVAVMPFQNMTGDTTWNIWQEGIQNELITSLTNTEELKVRQSETINNFLRGKDPVNYASLTPSTASDISQKLNANIFIYGTIKRAGDNIRLNARLVDSKTDEIFRSFEIDGEAREEMIFVLIDSLKRKIRDYIIINKLASGVYGNHQEIIYRLSNSPEAYRFYFYGRMAFRKRNYPAARNWFQQALEADSNFVLPAVYISVSYGNEALYEEARKWCLRIYNKRDLMPMEMKVLTNWLYANYFETPNEEIRYLNQALEIDEQSIMDIYLLGLCYIELEQYQKALHEFEKLLEIHERIGLIPFWAYSYTYLGLAYHETGEYKKEKKLYKQAEEDFPGDAAILYRQAVLALSTGKTKAADEYIDRYISALEESAYSEAAIASNLGRIYLSSGMLEKAEEYYRQALSLQPESATRMNNLASILIDNEINIEEGLELIDKALSLNPDDYLYLDTKGWGLYKQGKYEEALDYLEKSWELKPVYHHEVFLHLDAARKAMKNN